MTQNGADLTQKGADLTHFQLDKKGADLTQKGADLTNIPQNIPFMLALRGYFHNFHMSNQTHITDFLVKCNVKGSFMLSHILKFVDVSKSPY